MKPARSRSSTPAQFINRELSWLAFNERVLEEASSPSTPLLERIRFATIVSSNLDEFFMVRVAGLKRAIQEGDARPDPAGLTPAQQLAAVAERVDRMLKALYAVVLDTLLPAVAEHGIRLHRGSALDAGTAAALSAYFAGEVLPALTPLAIDVERPFPMLAGLSLNLAFWLAPESDAAERRLAVVQIPQRLQRLTRVAGAHAPEFVLLEDIVRSHAGQLFPGQEIVETAVFRLLRDSELELDDEGGESFLTTVEEGLRQRRRNDPVRLDVEGSASPHSIEQLARLAGADTGDVYALPGLLDLRVLSGLADQPGFDRLRYPPAPPISTLDRSEQLEIFQVLEERDLLLHLPYESFDPVVAFVSAAAEDPDVLAIKQTLYRTSGDSPVVAALTRAADHGKQVTVVVELMARFDESRNIRWARRLEQMGAHVIYGIRRYKVHAKICLVVRRTKAGLRRYVHLGTGNYNDGTARLYTDFGLLTSDAEIGADASAFWSALTGYSDPPHLRKLAMAPTSLRSRLLTLITRESQRAQAGQPAAIRAKMNCLTDVDMIRALYAASQAGVEVDLNVRGMCTLRPGVEGLSERIRVAPIVGRYLEHARAFVFHNGGEEQVYLASADWMTRNLDKRIELMFPVESPGPKRQVLDAMAVYFDDNVKARHLHANGTWDTPRRSRGAGPVEAQVVLYEQTVRNHEDAPHPAIEPLSAPRDEA